MKIVSWNINSVRLRMPLIAQFTQAHAPDVLCLQETKVRDELFPSQELEALGYTHQAFSGEKSYNGVCILSKVPLENIQKIDHAHTGQTRHIAATLPCGTELHNLYIPAGGDIPDVNENPKFKMKLDVLDALHAWSSAQPEGAKRIMLGDFNIAPLEHDVWSHKQLLKVVSHTPIEVERLTKLYESFGWQDAMRHFVPETKKVYSWWSYRARDWKAANKGRKLDHIWLSPATLPRLQSASIIADARGWEKPSDHAPVVAELSH